VATAAAILAIAFWGADGVTEATAKAVAKGTVPATAVGVTEAAATGEVRKTVMAAGRERARAVAVTVLAAATVMAVGRARGSPHAATVTVLAAATVTVMAAATVMAAGRARGSPHAATVTVLAAATVTVIAAATVMAAGRARQRVTTVGTVSALPHATVKKILVSEPATTSKDHVQQLQMAAATQERRLERAKCCRLVQWRHIRRRTCYGSPKSQRRPKARRACFPWWRVVVMLGGA